MSGLQSYVRPISASGDRSAWVRRSCFLWRAVLVVVIAVIGEIAALVAASVLHLDAVLTFATLASVVLSAAWPLRRCAA